jgi:hypothetical protein
MNDNIRIFVSICLFVFEIIFWIFQFMTQCLGIFTIGLPLIILKYFKYDPFSFLYHKSKILEVNNNNNNNNNNNVALIILDKNGNDSDASQSCTSISESTLSSINSYPSSPTLLTPPVTLPLSTTTTTTATTTLENTTLPTTTNTTLPATTTTTTTSNTTSNTIITTSTSLEPISTVGISNSTSFTSSQMLKHLFYKVINNNQTSVRKLQVVFFIFVIVTLSVIVLDLALIINSIQFVHDDNATIKNSIGNSKVDFKLQLIYDFIYLVFSVSVCGGIIIMYINSSVNKLLNESK